MTDAQLALLVALATTLITTISTMWTNWNARRISEQQMEHNEKIARFNASYSDHLQAFKDFAKLAAVESRNGNLIGASYSEFKKSLNVLYSYSSPETKEILKRYPERSQIDKTEYMFLLSDAVSKDLEKRRML